MSSIRAESSPERAFVLHCLRLPGVARQTYCFVLPIDFFRSINLSPAKDPAEAKERTGC